MKVILWILAHSLVSSFAILIELLDLGFTGGWWSSWLYPSLLQKALRDHTLRKKSWVVKCVNYWMKPSSVCMWVWVSAIKLCHAGHAPLHSFTGGTSLQCADLERSNSERSKHTHQARFHTETCTKHTHSHTRVHWCMVICMNALIQSISIYRSFCCRQSM